MNSEVLSRQNEITFSTVEEKILLEKQLPFNPKDKVGPTVNLYFHELAKEKSIGQKFLQFLGTVFLSVFFIISLPLISLLLKIASKETIFNKIQVPGRRGIVFEQYQYTTSNKLGSFLEKSGLYKLPSIINIWKGEMDLVGPRPYPATCCNNWNRQLSDYYKRFAFKPGYVGLQEEIPSYDDIDNVAFSLENELNYVKNPSLNKDLRHLLGIG